MGSWLSGRRPEKVVVSSSLTLDIGRMVRRGAFMPGALTRGIVAWGVKEKGDRHAAIEYEANMTDIHGAVVRLRYSVNGFPQDYRVWLRRTPCRLGGFRWWWQCPLTGWDAAKLYLPPGAKVFASRRAYPMAYRSERGGPIDRSHERQRRIFEKLGGSYRHFEQSPPRRPKGMHRRTYERLLAQLEAAENMHNLIFMAGARRFLGKDPIFARLLDEQ